MFSKNLEFWYENENILTNDSIVFIGESSDYLFLYFKKMGKTEIFSKSNLRKFRVNDPTIISKKDSLNFVRKFEKLKENLNLKDKVE